MKCGACEKWFEVPQIHEYVYGEFLLRAASGELRYLEAIGDDVFEEVSRIVENYKRVDERKHAEILHKAYGCAWDPDSHGKQFIVGKNPLCPHCGGKKVVAEESLYPSKHIDLDVPSVTHNEWSRLRDADKSLRVRTMIDKILKRRS